jgi:hypothetical protein
MSRIEEIAAEVTLIKDNHLAHIQDDITELKTRTLMIETKITIVEQYLGKAMKWILPAAIIMSAMVQTAMQSL